MSSRGNSLVENVRRQREERAADFGKRRRGDVVEDRPADGFVVLEPAVGRLKQLPPWDQLALEQPTLTENLLRTSTAGMVFAMQDRNLMSEPWRRIFAVRHGADFVLYSALGQIIDEPSDGVHRGRHSVEALVEEFSADGFYYRGPDHELLARARRHAQRDVRHVEPEKHAGFYR